MTAAEQKVLQLLCGQLETAVFLIGAMLSGETVQVGDDPAGCRHENAIDISCMGDTVAKMHCPECNARFERPSGGGNDD